MNGAGHVVLVGGGLAGARAATALREEGHDGPITLVGAEAHRPYERPPLSKGYLLGAVPRESLFVHPDDWYADNDVELRLSTRATGLDAAAQQIVLDDGDRLRYDRLFLATGSVPRPLTVPGADALQSLYLRTVDDSDRLRAAFLAGARVVIVGGGWIGLETAAAARAAGAEVVVLEHAELPLLRVLGAEMATLFAELHRDHGVDLRCGARIHGVRAGAPGAPGAGAVRLADGTEVAGDVVLVGVGVTPEVGLARQAGLAVDDGIVVDERMQTSNPRIFAAGDVVNAFHPLLGRHIRVEHWANALNQPAVAARAMLGLPRSYDRLPYFFSDQYDLGMEYTGYVVPGRYDRLVVRGDLAARQFIAFWLAGGRVLAGMNVNVWDVTAPIGDLVRSWQPVDPDRLADPSVPLTELIPSGTRARG